MTGVRAVPAVKPAKPSPSKQKFLYIEQVTAGGEEDRSDVQISRVNSARNAIFLHSSGEAKTRTKKIDLKI